MRDASTTPELLAPAGDWDALRAACANGADAVYFGLSAFNARHRAANFTPEELPKVVQFLHARNVRGFVTLNTLIFSDELEEVARYVRLIAEASADAVIVQDLGLARLIAQLAPDLHVHASTQMTLTEPRGVEWARERLSIRRAVLARELSVADIRKVAAWTSVPLEVFVHGALCVAYSGQCLTSEALGGRSANRGQCAQACRLPYEMIVDGEPRDLGDRAYLLSPQDLAAHEFVGELTDAGVISFKIEGRLKGPHYVAAATRAYRDAIDATADRRPFTLPADQARDVQQTFSRGFSPGFLEGPNHQRLVAGRFPKSRGILVGKVVGMSRRGVRVELTDSDSVMVAAGDGVVFDLGRPEEREPGGRVWEVRKLPSSTSRTQLELAFEGGALALGTIPVKARVWKTDDPAMRKRLEHTYVGDPIARRAPVWMTVIGNFGGPLRLTARDAEDREAFAEWAGPIEPARNHTVTIDSLREQLGRLGDSPFELADVESRLPADAMVPRSVLNDLRRQVTGELVNQRREHPRIEIIEPRALKTLRAEVAGDSWRQNSDSAGIAPTRVPRSTATLTVLVRTLDQLEAALPYRPAMVYCDFEDVRRYKEAVPKAKAAGIPVGLATLRILKPGDEGLLKPLLLADPDALLVRNLASMLYFREHATDRTQIGDFSLNVANELTADLFIREGLARLVPSYDLSWEQFTSLVRNSHPDWYEPVIHQHMPMFHNEFCTFAAFLSTGKDWRDCGRPCDRHRVDLKDRAGALFPVVADAGCRNTVYNSLPQSAAEYITRMLELGIRRFRIDLLRETADQVGPLIDTYRRMIDGQDDGRQTWRKVKAMNQLGVTRGTLQLV
jgi:U32 family peptidase